MGRPRIHPATFNCEVCDKEIENRNGQPKLRFCSKKCYGKSGAINSSGLDAERPWNKGLMGYKKGHPAYVRMIGDKNPAWKGGITSENTKIRNSDKYVNWRRSILERDKFTCQFCGIVGGPLHVDHIKPFSKFPELRFSDENARTLCVPCHRKTDTFAGKVFSYG